MDTSHGALLELLELQKIDSRIDVLENHKRNLEAERERAALQLELDDLGKVIADREGLLDDAARAQRKIEGDIEMIAAKIESEETKLHEVRSPRELTGLQAEIESLKRRKFTMEDGDLEVMEQKERLENELAELKRERDLLMGRVADATSRRDAASAQLDADLEIARKERSEWAPRIEAELLELYDDLRESKGGVGAAALVNGGCQGCHMTLPSQEVERIKKSEGLERCEECRRILVVV